MAANQWNPAQYMKGNMGDLRTRPVHDLIARIPVERAQRVVDLGCGPGNSTAPLKARWPDADVAGIDSNPAMLEKAQASHPGLTFSQGDISDWTPDSPVDVIFANASIHWVPDHRALLPRLLTHLNPGGCLAIQQPNNFAAPSHALIAEVAQLPEFREALAGKLVGDFVRDVTFYHDLLRPLSGHLDIWETEYVQPMTGDDPVLEWVRGTTLLPVRQALSDDAFAAYEDIYRQRLRAAYPMAADGTTLFPFRRMFMVAVPE